MSGICSPTTTCSLYCVRERAYVLLYIIHFQGYITIISENTAQSLTAGVTSARCFWDYVRGWVRCSSQGRHCGVRRVGKCGPLGIPRMGGCRTTDGG